MRILIVTPIVEDAVTGNLASANRWAYLLRELGHEVELAAEYSGQTIDLLVALNAARSAPSVTAFRAAHPGGRVVVVLTGTDIYPEPEPAAIGAMREADRLVALQDKAEAKVPEEWREKVRVIVQSAERARQGESSGEGGDRFDVAVVANLREVKDPLRAAAAARLLPEESKLRVRHAGVVLEDRFAELARRESEENPRYEWLGGVSLDAALRLIADSDLLVLSSLSEGAGRVVGEAAVAGVPVLSTRVDGVVGLLGEGYPGYFPVGDTGALAELLGRAETDPTFLKCLTEECEAVAGRFSPQAELAGWRELLGELVSD